jgi:hypothetical protein
VSWTVTLFGYSPCPTVEDQGIETVDIGTLSCAGRRSDRILEAQNRYSSRSSIHEVPLRTVMVRATTQTSIKIIIAKATELDPRPFIENPSFQLNSRSTRSHDAMSQAG